MYISFDHRTDCTKLIMFDDRLVLMYDGEVLDTPIIVLTLYV